MTVVEPMPRPWRECLIWAEAETNDLCTAAVMERWKWWRPGWSSGYAQGVRDAQAVVLTALLDAREGERATPESAEPTSRADKIAERVDPDHIDQWLDADFEIDTEVITLADGRRFLSVNGQGHFPLPPETAERYA